MSSSHHAHSGGAASRAGGDIEDVRWRDAGSVSSITPSATPSFPSPAASTAVARISSLQTQRLGIRVARLGLGLSQRHPVPIDL